MSGFLSVGWPFMIGAVNQNQLFVFNWKTLLSCDTLEKLENRPTCFLYNRPVRHALLSIYEQVLGGASWIKDNGCQFDRDLPHRWDTCTSFVDHPNLDDILHAHNIWYLKYQCNPSDLPSQIWGKVKFIWKSDTIEYQLHPNLDAQYQSHLLTQHIYEDVSLGEKLDQKRKM